MLNGGCYQKSEKACFLVVLSNHMCVTCSCYALSATLLSVRTWVVMYSFMQMMPSLAAMKVICI